MRNLFVTKLHEAEFGDESFLKELAHSIRTLSRDDTAGRKWSKEHGYEGYTSYASLNDLPRRDPVFAKLARLLTREASNFAEECAFDLDHRPRLDSLWVNLLKSTGHHSGHIHPHSLISGTYYVEVAKGSGAIRFEDPRLAMMMASSPRRNDAPEDLQTFVSIDPRAGLVVMWESWLRHEILPGKGRGDRLSISFNFA